ncbi:MAG: glycosyltransferase family 39 protein [Acidobacteria bacterium]|nr:glycosyltransferase family 39 protein [Acidobacteriota bacterium]
MSSFSRLTRAPWAETGAAALLAFLLFFNGTGRAPLIGRDEPRFAEAAREMLARGDFVVPTFGGINRYDKPILIYWCTMASYAVFGVNERAARLPSNLAGALLIAMLAWWARRRWGPGAGVTAGLLLAVTLTFHLETHGCTADMVMLLPTLAAMLALHRLTVEDGGAGAAAVFWLGMALSMLAKGPVGPAIAIFTGVGAWALARSWRRWEAVGLSVLLLAGWWRLGPEVLAVPLAWSLVEALRSSRGRKILGSLRWAWGVPLLFLVTLPWGILAWRETAGEFFRVGVGKHVVARSLKPLESHGGFPGFYLVTGLVAAFPLFAFLPSAFKALWRPVRRDATFIFLSAWLLGPLVMLELIRTKLVHYWMGSYPAGVLLVVWWLFGRASSSGRSRWTPWLLLAGGLLVAALPAGLVVYFHLSPLLAGSVALGGVLAAGSVWATFVRPPRLTVWIAIAGTALFLAGLFGWFLPQLGSRLVGPRGARRALEIRQPAERIVIYKARDDDLFFYLPLDAVNCRPMECLEREIRSGTGFLGVARLDDLETFEGEHSGLHVKIVSTVTGIDLGHGRWAKIALFRPVL